MDSSRVVLALEEQVKWRDRRKRVEERIRQVKARRRYFLRELEATRGKLAQFGALLGSLRGRAAQSKDARPAGEKSPRWPR